METQVTRLVVRGPEAWNTVRAERLLLSALERTQEHRGLSILLTPGGFLRAPWPSRWAGRTGWSSGREDIAPLVDSATATALNSVSSEVLGAARRRGVDFITLGVDLLGPARSGSRAHAELVIVVNTEDGSVAGWTGKSYPTASQERHLVQVADLSTHLMSLAGVRTLILGCHDLNMFSPRGRASQREGGHRHQRSTAMRELVRTKPPRVILHHPHTVDTPRIWSGAWSGLREAAPAAEVWASGIWFHDWRNGPRGRLGSTMRSSASEGVLDVVLHLPLEAGQAVAVLVDGQWERGHVADYAVPKPVDASDEDFAPTTPVRLDLDGHQVDVPPEFLLWDEHDMPFDAGDTAPAIASRTEPATSAAREEPQDENTVEKDEEWDVWERVRAVAQKHLTSAKPIHTLKRRVPNIITSVDADKIERRSAEGRSNQTPVRRSHVRDAWEALAGGTPKGDYPVFTHALLLAALPDRLVLRDGALVLRRRAD